MTNQQKAINGIKKWHTIVTEVYDESTKKPVKDIKFNALKTLLEDIDCINVTYDNFKAMCSSKESSYIHMYFGIDDDDKLKFYFIDSYENLSGTDIQSNIVILPPSLNGNDYDCLTSNSSPEDSSLSYSDAQTRHNFWINSNPPILRHLCLSNDISNKSELVYVFRILKNDFSTIFLNNPTDIAALVFGITTDQGTSPYSYQIELITCSKKKLNDPITFDSDHIFKNLTTPFPPYGKVADFPLLTLADPGNTWFPGY